MLRGSKIYWSWVLVLATLAICGLVQYIAQLRHGLVITGMSDQVSWGVYIANFTFLVGMAAAAVMLVIPAYIFESKHAKSVVLLAEGVAVAACSMALLFVIVDLGHPERFWHFIPFVGKFNWPISLLSWDVIVLNGYLALNLFVPMYFLYHKYLHKPYNLRAMWPVIILSMFWAVSIHTVTAFLYSSNAGRPFWHTALLGPRFLASAFAAGPAFIIIAFRTIDHFTDFKVSDGTIRLLSIITAVGLQVNLFMVGTEVFTEFYTHTEHSASAQYLFLGLGESHALLPWIYTALSIEVVAVVILMVKRWRTNMRLLSVACVFTAVGIWIEKGMGLIVPGFVPTPLGEVLEYSPTHVEVIISLGIWSFGFLVMTLLAKAAIAIETGRLGLGLPATAADGAVAQPPEREVG